MASEEERGREYMREGEKEYMREEKSVREGYSI
jgi:hypothetical protein